MINHGPPPGDPYSMMAVLISYLADRLKDAYVFGGEKRKFYSVIEFIENRATSSFSLGSDDDIWRSLASKLMKIGGDDGADYMMFQFRNGPFPKSLADVCSDSALEAYREEIHSKDPIVRAREAVDEQLGRVNSCMDLGHPLEQILREQGVHLNPLINYCLAVAGKCEYFIRQFAADARLFLFRYPVYRALLGPLFVEPVVLQGDQTRSCRPLYGDRSLIP